MGCQDRFDSLDTNKDGKVTKDEFMAVPHYRGNAEEMFKTMDVNGHGYITKDEFCAGKGKGGRMGKGDQSVGAREKDDRGISWNAVRPATVTVR